jgi:hypothetical protein
MVKKLGEPRYQVPRELVESLAFRTLPDKSKLLWHDMMFSYRGSNNGNINAALGDLAQFGWKSSASLAKALAYLIAHGFISETRKGGGNQCSLNQCCLYRFTHLPVNANPKIGIGGGQPTFDYRFFDPTKLPEKVTLSTVKGLSGKNSCFGKRSVTLRKLKPRASDTEVRAGPMLQKLKRGNLPICAEILAPAGLAGRA